jgi:hypothetical protein
MLSATWQHDVQRMLAREQETRVMKLLTLVPSAFLPLSYVVSAVGASGGFGSTDYMASLSWTVRLPFFIPKTATGITELDQMFALCVGVVALLYSLLHAFKSLRKEEEIVEAVNRQREAEELEDRRRLTMSLALSLLELLDERLGQAINEREREAILERRNRLLDGMSRMM